MRFEKNMPSTVAVNFQMEKFHKKRKRMVLQFLSIAWKTKKAASLLGLDEA